jgi:DNA adenine methylase
MVIKALAPWYGGKRNLAAAIVQQLGKHRAYWEPFCGGMSVLLSKPAATMETVNDLHGDLVNLARIVQDPQDGPRLYRMLRRTLLAQATHLDGKFELEASDCEPGLLRAYWYFLASWFGRNGVAGTDNYNNGFCVRYTKNGGHAAKRFASAVDSIPAWRRRMRTVTVLSQDAIATIDRIEDAPGVAIYCDPPYLVKGAKYLHDFDARTQGAGLFGDGHDRLAQALHRFRHTRVVVSYYAHPRLDDLYPPELGWNRLAIEVTKAMASQGARHVGRNTKKAIEVLLVNGEVFRGGAAGEGTRQ